MQDQQEEERAIAELKRKMKQREALSKLAIAEAECEVYDQAINSSERSLSGSTLCLPVNRSTANTTELPSEPPYCPLRQEVSFRSKLQKEGGQTAIPRLKSVLVNLHARQHRVVE